MVEENIIKKITKLLAMAAMGTGNEAEVASKKARLLMERYGLTQDDIELFTVDIPEAKKKRRWVLMLHDMVATFSGVVSISGYKVLIFAGDELGVNVARELFYYLKGEIMRKADESKIAGLAGRNDFKIGAALGLYERMQNCGGWRDMKIKRREATKKYFSDMKKKAAPPVGVSGPFARFGLNAAKDINLNRQAGHNGASGFIEGGKAK